MNVPSSIILLYLGIFNFRFRVLHSPCLQESIYRTPSYSTVATVVLGNSLTLNITATCFVFGIFYLLSPLHFTSLHYINVLLMEIKASEKGGCTVHAGTGIRRQSGQKKSGIEEAPGVRDSITSEGGVLININMIAFFAINYKRVTSGNKSMMAFLLLLRWSLL